MSLVCSRQGAELIVDGGVRQKNQKAAFFFATPTMATTDPLNAVDSVLTTSSITPRVKLNGIAGGMPVECDRQASIITCLTTVPIARCSSARRRSTATI